MCFLSHVISSFPRSKEEEEKTEHVWLKGHYGMLDLELCGTKRSLSSLDTDCVSVLWSQPIGGLQIRSPDGKWRWVKHMDNALVGLILSSSLAKAE